MPDQDVGPGYPTSTPELRSILADRDRRIEALEAELRAFQERTRPIYRSAEGLSDEGMPDQDVAALTSTADREDLWNALVASQAALERCEAERVRLVGEIEDYLLWRPGEKGHAEAQKKLSAALK